MLQTPKWISPLYYPSVTNHIHAVATVAAACTAARQNRRCLSYGCSSLPLVKSLLLFSNGRVAHQGGYFHCTICLSPTIFMLLQLLLLRVRLLVKIVAAAYTASRHCRSSNHCCYSQRSCSTPRWISPLYYPSVTNHIHAVATIAATGCGYSS
jgi:hypothetical protein